MAINNPYVPGDPYSYDLKWIVKKIKEHSTILSTLDEKIVELIIQLLDQHDPLYWKSADELIHSDMKTPSLAYIEGYYEPGDGGASLYYITSDYNDVLAAPFYITLDGANRWAIPVLTTPYVTPEMFGAKGDGSEDDHDALEKAMNFGVDVYFMPKDYHTESTINLDVSGVKYHGNGCTIERSVEGNLLIISSACNSLAFENMSFYTPISVNSDTGVVVAQKASTTAGPGESANNLSFSKCVFEGGTIELGLYSATGVTVEDCTFKNTAAKTSGTIGGYCILLQSAYNIGIKNCLFTEQKQVRHSVYISVDPTKTQNIECKNVSVENCYFDHSDQVFWTTNTSAILTRATDGAKISNNTFYKCVGISFTSSDGILITEVSNNVFKETVYNTDPYQNRFCLNFIAGATDSELYLDCHGNIELSSDGLGGSFATFGPKCRGSFQHNETTQSKYIVLDGDVYVNDNKTANGYAYRLDSTTYTGRIGEEVACASTDPLAVGSSGSLYLRQIPDEWLHYRFAENYNTITGVTPKWIVPTVTKNSVNNYTMSFSQFADTYCDVIQCTPEYPYFMRASLAGSPFRVTVWAVDANNQAYTTAMNAQAFFLKAR